MKKSRSIFIILSILLSNLFAYGQIIKNNKCTIILKKVDSLRNVQNLPLTINMLRALKVCNPNLTSFSDSLISVIYGDINRQKLQLKETRISEKFQKERAKFNEQKAEIRRIQQLSENISDKYPDRKILLLLEALRLNNYKLEDAPLLEQSIRKNLKPYFNSEVFRHKKLSNVEISNDGNWVATGGEDSMVSIIDNRSKDLSPKYLIPHGNKIGCLKFSPDNKWLISGTIDESSFANFRTNGNIILLPIGQEKKDKIILSGFKSDPEMIQFSPDGNIMAILFSDKTFRIWKFGVNGPIGEYIQLINDTVLTRFISFSPKGKWFLTSNNDGSARLWITDSIFSNNQPIQLTGHDALAVGESCFSPDENFLVTTSVNNTYYGNASITARLWNLRSQNFQIKAITFKIRDHYLNIRKIEFSPDSKWFDILSGDAPDIRVWNVERYALSGNQSDIHDFSIEGRTGENYDYGYQNYYQITNAAYSHDSKSIALGNDDGTIKLINLNSLQSELKTRLLIGHDAKVNDIIFSEDDNYLYSASDDGTIRIWETKDHYKPPTIIKDNEGAINKIAISNNRLISISFYDPGIGDQSIRFYNLFNFLPLSPQTLKIINGDYITLNYSLNKKWICLNSYNKETLIKLGHSNNIDTIITIQGDAIKNCFSSNNKWFITYYHNQFNFIFLENLKTYNLPIVPTNGNSYRFEGKFTKDDKSIVISDDDGEVWITDLSNGIPFIKLHFVLTKDKIVDSLKLKLSHDFVLSDDSKSLFLSYTFYSDNFNVQDTIISKLYYWDLSKATLSQPIEFRLNKFIIHSSTNFKNSFIFSNPIGSIKIVQIQNGVPQEKFVFVGGGDKYPFDYSNLYISTDSKKLVTFSQQNAFLWNLDDKNIRKKLIATGMPNAIDGFYTAWDKAVFSPANNFLALVQKGEVYSSGNEGKGRLRTITLVSLDEKSKSQVLPYINDEAFEKILFSNDDRYLITGGEESINNVEDYSTIQLWDLSNSFPLNPRRLSAHNFTVKSFVFSSDSKYLFSASIDHTIIKWDLNSDFPDKNFTLLQEFNKAVFLNSLYTIPLDTNSIISIEKIGASYHNNEIIKIDRYDYGTKYLLELAKKCINRNFSIVEWRRFFGLSPYQKEFVELPIYSNSDD